MSSRTSLPIFLSLSILPLCAATAAQPSQGNQAKAPAGYVIIAEEVSYALPENYPDEHMKKAEKDLQKKDLKAAARDTRKAQVYLKGQATRSGAQSDSALNASIMELEKLAEALDAGTSVLEKDMEQAFARAHLALAGNDREKAAEHLSQNENGKAGEELKAGANHVQKASDWSGSKLDKAAKTVLEKSKELSTKLVSGVGFVSKETGEGIAALGSEIQKLGMKLEKSKGGA